MKDYTLDSKVTKQELAKIHKHIKTNLAYLQNKNKYPIFVSKIKTK